MLAGYYEYGLWDDPAIRGSLVKVKGAKSDWRVMARKGDLLSLLRSDRRDPFYEKDVPIESTERNVRERVAVRSIDGTASTICRFGEPGAVGAPGHQLLFPPVREGLCTRRCPPSPPPHTIGKNKKGFFLLPQ